MNQSSSNSVIKLALIINFSTAYGSLLFTNVNCGMLSLSSFYLYTLLIILLAFFVFISYFYSSNSII